jgi:hypothetical protein
VHVAAPGRPSVLDEFGVVDGERSVPERSGLHVCNGDASLDAVSHGAMRGTGGVHEPA